MENQIIKANIVDIHSKDIYCGTIEISGSAIKSITRTGETDPSIPFIAPGLVDSHVHIESSMLVPSRFSEMVIPCGTVGILCDPHEIANVMGRVGVEYMMSEAANSPLKMFFGVPSCVPATSFETSGGVINEDDVDYLFDKGAAFLAEMMNYPGVLYNDTHVWNKINIAKRRGKPIDGHAPSLVGDDLKKYIRAGISTDHECSNIDEALQRIEEGMFVQIREGSAARNFEQLYPLISSHPNNVMLCTDDSHPDDISEKGHIDKIVRMAIKKGVSIFDIYRAALVNAVNHYNLPVGLLRVNDPADFIVIDNPSDFNIISTYINGSPVYHNGKLNYHPDRIEVINNFIPICVSEDDIKVRTAITSPRVRVIDIEEGELLTKEYIWNPAVENGLISPSPDENIAKIVVVNRYQQTKPAIGFIRGMGITKGAFGASIAHDSHNLVVIGCDDVSILKVIETLSEQKGGICCYSGGESELLPLPIGGLMSDKSGVEVAQKYAALNDFVKTKSGVTIQAPFMTLSFMSLLVIPSLKLGDRGLFNVDEFEFVDLIF